VTEWGRFPYGSADDAFRPTMRPKAADPRLDRPIPAGAVANALSTQRGEDTMNSHASYRYRVVDVFTSERFEGNPLGVFPEATGLSTELMGKIARELNLSETVFLLPARRSECAAKLRIFTPRTEIDFAGHPTLGAAYILLDDGKVPSGTTRFVVEENVGPISIRTVDSGPSLRLWLMSPPVREDALVDPETAAALLGLERDQLLDLPPQILSAGNPTLFIAVSGRDTVDRISLDPSAWTRFKATHHSPLSVFAFSPTPDGAYSRMFGPDYGVREDPATGSATGPLASYMMKHRLVSSRAGTAFHSEQGTAMGRRSILYVLIHGEGGVDGIEVGGHVAPVAEGTMTV
jgi:trans-2,3-dihydro-3-hydroxyanthranilate isomerase